MKSKSHIGVWWNLKTPGYSLYVINLQCHLTMNGRRKFYSTVFKTQVGSPRQEHRTSITAIWILSTSIERHPENVDVLNSEQDRASACRIYLSQFPRVPSLTVSPDNQPAGEARTTTISQTKTSSPPARPFSAAAAASSSAAGEVPTPNSFVDGDSRGRQETGEVERHHLALAQLEMHASFGWRPYRNLFTHAFT